MLIMKSRDTSATDRSVRFLMKTRLYPSLWLDSDIRPCLRHCHAPRSREVRLGMSGRAVQSAFTRLRSRSLRRVSWLADWWQKRVENLSMIWFFNHEFLLSSCDWWRYEEPSSLPSWARRSTERAERICWKIFLWKQCAVETKRRSWRLSIALSTSTNEAP